MPELNAAVVWNAAVTLVIAPLAWFLKGSIEKVSKLETSLQDLRNDIARNYPTKSEIDNDMDRLIARFDRLEEKLDRALSGHK